jgi:hypothetical protein
MTAPRRDRVRRCLAAAFWGCVAAAGFSDPGWAQARVDRSGEIRLERMRFTVVQSQSGAPVIAAEGDIMPGAAEQFRALARGRNLQGARVLINSRGGSLLAALQLGVEFRQAGASVAVARVARSGGDLAPTTGVCMSACVYALAGAANRVVPAGSSVGVHASFRPERRNGRLYLPANQRSAEEPVLDEIKARYFASMGVDPSIVRLESGVSPTQIRRLSGSELHRYRLAGSGQAAARWSGGAIYPSRQEFDWSSR